MVFRPPLFWFCSLLFFLEWPVCGFPGPVGCAASLDAQFIMPRGSHSTFTADGGPAPVAPQGKTYASAQIRVGTDLLGVREPGEDGLNYPADFWLLTDTGRNGSKVCLVSYARVAARQFMRDTFPPELLPLLASVSNNTKEREEGRKNKNKKDPITGEARLLMNSPLVPVRISRSL